MYFDPNGAHYIEYRCLTCTRVEIPVEVSRPSNGDKTVGVGQLREHTYFVIAFKLDANSHDCKDTRPFFSVTTINSLINLHHNNNCTTFVQYQLHQHVTKNIL